MIKHLTLFVLLYSAIQSASYSQKLSDTPGILIEREIDAASVTVTRLKGLYKQCVNLKQQNMKLRSEQPSFWKTASLSYSPEYVKNITVLPSSEPPWKKEIIGLKREKEYFLGVHYILISERFNYELTKDGLCRLIKTKEESRTIDNGQTIFRSFRKTNARVINPKEPYDDPWMNNVPFNKSRIKKKVSPVVGGAKSNKELSNTLSKNQSLSEKLAALKQLNNNQGSSTTSTPNTNSRLDGQSLVDSMKAIINAFALSTEKASDSAGPSTNANNSAAGQKCDWVKPQNIASNVCYWSTSHIYPSALRRPIILKKNYNNVKEQAVVFQFIESIPDELMAPPK